MNLSSDLISQFAKITNDGNERKTEEVTLYGEIVQFGDSLCVKLDGSNEMTPAITTATIKVGDRVSAVIKNHTAIITGNFSDPAIGNEKVRIDIDQKVGVIFTCLEDGTTIINGACIKTGTIDADRINLTGSITFGDLSDNLAQDINETLDVAENAMDIANEALDVAEDAAYDASSARSVARSIANGTYLSGTFINGTTIQSPTIEGNDIRVYGTFQTMGLYSDGSMMPTGYMGAATGKDSSGITTYGVALSYAWDPYDYSVSDSYVIVTEAGVRLQHGNNSITVTDTGAYYNGVEIGSGSGTAVFG